MAEDIPTGYKHYRSYRKQSEARDVATMLRKRGYTVTTREVAVKGKGVMFRVFYK